jgi:hypothetical protein
VGPEFKSQHCKKKKRERETLSQPIRLGTVVHDCPSSYVGNTNRNIIVQSLLGHKVKPYSTNSQSKNVLGDDSCGKVPGWQGQVPEFKSQYQLLKKLITK